MEEIFYSLGFGTSFIIALIVGSILFWQLLQHEVVFNPSLYGYFIQWATCVGGIFIVLLLGVGVIGAVIGWIFDLIGAHYKLLIGIVVAIIGMGIYSGRQKNGTNTIDEPQNHSAPSEKEESVSKHEQQTKTFRAETDAQANNHAASAAMDSSIRYCDNCGAKLEQKDRFCGSCGKAIH